MADVKVCDRCGKPIVQEKLLFGYTGVKGYCVLFRHMTNWRDSLKNYDLCLDCAEEFKKWVKKDEQN